jgi:hypothetical protein
MWVDVSGLDHIDTAELQLLLDARQLRGDHGCEFRIRSPSSMVAQPARAHAIVMLASPSLQSPGDVTTGRMPARGAARNRRKALHVGRAR